MCSNLARHAFWTARAADPARAVIACAPMRRVALLALFALGLACSGVTDTAQLLKKLNPGFQGNGNVSTELKHTLINAKWEYLSAHRDEYDPGKPDVFVRDATRKAVMHWMDKLGCNGKA